MESPLSSDAALLATYAASQDETAFAELVSRHGSMVYGVCLRILDDAHEAEDATQATFLILLRKARRLRNESKLAAWLHGAAVNVARQAVRARARRGRHEWEATMRKVAGPSKNLTARERSVILENLDAALASLPARLRQAVVLRYLEGLSQEEAARLAGCPSNTLASRAMRGLDKLRKRLLHQQGTLSAPALTALLADQANAAVPQALLPAVASIPAAATGMASAAIKTHVLALAEAGMKALFLAKVKLVAGVMASMLILGATTATLITQALAANSASALKRWIPLEVDTGFYDRENEPVQADIRFRRSVSPKSLILFREAHGEMRKTAFHFEPKGRYKGTLRWRLGGKVDSLTRVSYRLHFARGRWSEEPVGSERIAAGGSRTQGRRNLIANPGFEKLAPDGTKPATWSLHQMRGSSLPSLSRLSDEEAHEGKRSLRLDEEKVGGKRLLAWALGPYFPLKPDTKYTFSYYIKIIKCKAGSRAISAEIQFCDENKRRVHPKNYGLNRLQVAYGMSRIPPEQYLGKWVKVERSKVTSQNVRYGRVRIGTWYFDGTVFVDSMALTAAVRGEPVEVSVGTEKRTGGRP